MSSERVGAFRHGVSVSKPLAGSVVPPCDIFPRAHFALNISHEICLKMTLYIWQALKKADRFRTNSGVWRIVKHFHFYESQKKKNSEVHYSDFSLVILQVPPTHTHTKCSLCWNVWMKPRPLLFVNLPVSENAFELQCHHYYYFIFLSFAICSNSSAFFKLQ